MKTRRKLIAIISVIVVIETLCTLYTYHYIHREGLETGQEAGQQIRSEPSEATSPRRVISATCISLYDEYAGDDKLAELYEEDNVFTRLQNFNQKLNENSNYYEVSFQALQSFEYYSLDENFVKIYNQKGGKIENQLVEFEGETCFVTSVNTIQFNKNFNDKFLVPMQNGDVFANEDFVLNNLDRIPVILGYQYKKYFDLGDTIKLNYLGTNFTFYIKGFLRENSELRENDEIFNLDNYICMPNFQYYPSTQMSQDNEYFIFLMRYYLQNSYALGVSSCHMLYPEKSHPCPGL